LAYIKETLGTNLSKVCFAMLFLLCNLPGNEVTHCGDVTEIELIFFMQLETFLSHS